MKCEVEPLQSRMVPQELHWKGIGDVEGEEQMDHFEVLVGIYLCEFEGIHPLHGGVLVEIHFQDDGVLVEIHL